ncbi:hypothetical protein ACRQ5B_12300 [Pseudarthrobacter sp. L19]|uniref:hypothetical protein n=1 Tax=Pseudarthrobacter sp. L19 TaxID=3423951 RepID=UPI003D7B37DC
MKRTIAAAGILSLALLGTAGTAYASPAGSDTEVHSGATTQGSATPGDGTKTPGKDNQHGSGGWTGGGAGNSDHQGGGGSGGDKGDHGGGSGGWGGGNGGDKGDHGGGWGGGNGGDKGDHGGGWGGGNGDEGDCDTPSDPPVEPTTPPTTPPVVTPPVVTPPVVTPPVVTPPVVTPPVVTPPAPAVQRPAVIPAGAAAAVQPAPAVNAGYNVQTAAGSNHGLPVWLVAVTALLMAGAASLLVKSGLRGRNSNL